jgi:hypothetical protein
LGIEKKIVFPNLKIMFARFNVPDMWHIVFFTVLVKPLAKRNQPILIATGYP